VDGKLRKVILRVGPLKMRTDRNRYAMLVRSILSQQISVSAATSIRNKLLSLVDGQLEPERIMASSDEHLRSAGISPQKLRYLRDLSGRVSSGELQLAQIGRFSDEGVIERLTTVKGIGRWTAQMFLMFSLGRLNILPHDDLGIQNAMRNLYELDERPNRAIMDEIAEPWRPFASVASWYCWQSLNLDSE
jgi:DNA-3-methyladenine glycosylase II